MRAESPEVRGGAAVTATDGADADHSPAGRASRRAVNDAGRAAASLKASTRANGVTPPVVTSTRLTAWPSWTTRSPSGRRSSPVRPVDVGEWPDGPGRDVHANELRRRPRSMRPERPARGSARRSTGAGTVARFVSALGTRRIRPLGRSAATTPVPSPEAAALSCREVGDGRRPVLPPASMRRTRGRP